MLMGRILLPVERVDSSMQMPRASMHASSPRNTQDDPQPHTSPQATVQQKNPVAQHQTGPPPPPRRTASVLSGSSNATMAKFNTHTFECALLESKVWIRKICFERAFEPLVSLEETGESFPAKHVHASAVALRYRVTKLDSQTKSESAVPCGDSFHIRLFSDTDNVHFAPMHVAEQADDCGLHTAYVLLPPWRGLFSIDLRLVHVAGEGMTDPTPALEARLKHPAGVMGDLELSVAGPVFFNIAPDFAGLLMVDNPARLPAQAQLCSGTSDLLDRHGWWLPAHDAAYALFRPHHMDWVPASGCKTNFYNGFLAKDMLATRARDRPIALIGESVMQHVHYQILQHADADNMDWSHIGEYYFGDMVRTPLYAKYSRDSVPGLAPNTVSHGLAVLEATWVGSQDMLWKDVPVRTPIIAIISGANDMMRSTMAKWRAGVETFLQHLEGWDGTLVWISSPIRVYKCGGSPGQYECFDGDRKEICRTPLNPENPQRVFKPHPDGLLTPTGQPVGTYDWEPKRSGHWAPVMRLFNTYDRMRAANDIARELLQKMRPYPRSRFIDMGTLSDALSPDFCCDGVHWCGPDEYFKHAAVGRWHPTCFLTNVIANSLLNLVDQILPRP